MRSMHSGGTTLAGDGVTGAAIVSAGVSPVRTHAFVGAMAIGALLRTAPYAILGQGLGSGSMTTILIAGASVALGGVLAGLLMRQIRRTDAALA